MKKMVVLGGIAEPPPSIDLSGGPAFPLDAHLESKDLAAGNMTFDEIFEAGGDLFTEAYNGLDGVGAFRLPDGSTIHRFSAFPPGGGAGAPISSQSCVGCHNTPSSAGAGVAQTNVPADLNRDGAPPFSVRSTTLLWGNGIMQLLAQEVTEELQAIRDGAAEQAKANPGTVVELELASKGISYGTIAATADEAGEVSFDLTGREGLDPDLVVRPMGWKGNVTTIRSNNLGAAANLMGMQAEELVWMQPPGKDFNPDPDGDGIEREFSTGDMTAMVVYGAAQETPQSVERLAELGFVAAPSEEDLSRIERGRALFSETACSSCHIPELHLKNTVFEEPTSRGNGHYYDHQLAERDADYDPARPVRFDLLEVAQEPRAEPHSEGGAIIRAYGDLKRHHMGRHLADPGGPQPPITANNVPLTHNDKIVLIAPTAFLTPELWGVGNTAPYLHDGRAATLREAVLLHGEDEPAAPGDPGRGEAQESRDAFVDLAEEEQEALLTFLRSLRAFGPPES
jgi:mono/diheme cytochrome c family protein